MWRGFLRGSFCLNRGGTTRRLLIRTSTPSPFHPFRPTKCPRAPTRNVRGTAPVTGKVLFAALTPLAFLELAEGGSGHGKTGQDIMLENSREEVQKSVQKDVGGLSSVRQRISVFLWCYIYDPLATGVRFLHLVVIFAPVVLTIPSVWFGRKVTAHHGTRSGTLWWYNFLVSAMQRAGPAFIKVSQYPITCRHSTGQTIDFPLKTAWAMGSIPQRYIPPRTM